MSKNSSDATLKERIDAFQDRMMSQAPAEVIAALGRELEPIAAIG